MRPEVHAPAQKHGNVDEVPLFRNHFNQDKKGRTSKSTARANPSAAVNLRPPLLGPIIGHTTDTTCRIWMQAAEPGDRGAIYSRERMTIGLVAVVAKDGERIRKPRLYLFRLHRHNNRIGLLDIGRDGGLDVDQGNRLLAPNTDYTIRTAVLVVDEFSARTDLITDAEVVSRLPASRFLLEELSRLPSRDSEASLHTFPAEGTIAKQISFVLSTCSYRDMSKQPSRRCQY